MGAGRCDTGAFAACRKLLAHVSLTAALIAGIYEAVILYTHQPYRESRGITFDINGRSASCVHRIGPSRRLKRRWAAAGSMGMVMLLDIRRRLGVDDRIAFL
jgi:hypothetical protein